MKASVFPKGAVILAEGQASRGVFLLCQGQAKMFRDVTAEIKVLVGKET